MHLNHLTAVSFALAALAAPTSPQTHDIQLIKRNGVKSAFYYPKPVSKSFPVSHVVTRDVSEADITVLATAALIKEFTLDASELKITQSHTDDAGVTHIYFVRTINGVTVDNNNCAVHIKNGKVIQASSSFSGGLAKREEKVQPPTMVVSLEDAVQIASKELAAPRDAIPAKFVYVQSASGKLIHAHQFQLRSPDNSKFYQVSVATDNGQLVQVVDFMNKASYNAIALPNSDPRDKFSTVTDPSDKKASPNGWHKDTKTYTDTQGNNAISAVSGKTVSGGSSLEFDTKFNPAEDATSEANKRAATVNTFYLVNRLHDITYNYGFTEAAGNFQNSNFGKGGEENDRVIISNQAEGMNNAEFGTPPDGQNGVMNMFRFNITSPNRDGSLDNGIPVHEFMHGVTNRLTGGSRQGNCLQTYGSAGMGEGWGDALAMFLQRKESDTRQTDVVMGSYVVNKASGIRNYPYSTNTKTNPLSFSTLNTLDEVHDIGEVWATILNEVYWNLVDKHGFSSEWLDSNQKKGNIIMLKLLIGGLKLQPCNPTFINARDAILKADETYYKGENKCLIWKGFAKRGMGKYADDTKRAVFDSKLPRECRGL
ncbi:hypothetical protein HDV02_003131 [Globomyces sp. JEL0801]|nr:hypothetical protein HDV02_003131 [Globomyces sp. JEL0801]